MKDIERKRGGDVESGRERERAEKIGRERERAEKIGREQRESYPDYNYNPQLYIIIE